MNTLPLNIDLQQILLHMLNFVILFAILYFLLYKPVKEFMNKRSEYYKSMDEKAKKDLEQAEKTKAYYDEKLSNAENEIKQKKILADKEIFDFKKDKMVQAQALADEIVAKSKIESEKEKEQIILSANKEIAGIIISATEKIAPDKNTKDVYDDFLNSVKPGDKK